MVYLQLCNELKRHPVWEQAETAGFCLEVEQYPKNGGSLVKQQGYREEGPEHQVFAADPRKC